MKSNFIPALLLVVLPLLTTPAQAVMRGAPVRDQNGARASTVAVHTPVALCSGTIIGPRLVVTAAHCLVHRGAYRIRFISRDGVAKTIRVSRFSRHGAFNAQDGFSANDIGLIETAAAFPPDMKSAVFPGWGGGGSSLSIAGFGSTESSGNRASQLRTAVLEAGEPSIPGRGFRGLATPAGGARRGMCVGDSGGPVFATGSDPLVLTGVLKGGTIDQGTACTSQPLYTPVSPFRDWLNMLAQGWNQTIGPVQ